MYADKREGIYVVNGEGNLDGLIMRGHIIAKLVYELLWYFNGAIPLSQNNMLGKIRISLAFFSLQFLLNLSKSEL
jgi:hypothetical protein